MSDLVTKWTAQRDHVHRGFTARGLVTGASVLRGCGWPANCGIGYVLKRGTQSRGGRILDAVVVGAALDDATSIGQAAWVEQTPGRTYVYQCVPVGPGGVEAVVNLQDPQIAKVVINDAGEAPEAVPPAPRGLQVTVLAGGVLRLSWQFVASTAFAAVDEFRIYHDNGTGTMDWVTEIGTVAARRINAGAGIYRWDTDPYADTTVVRLGVRSVSPAGAIEHNTRVVIGTADASGPPAHAIQSCSWGADV